MPDPNTRALPPPLRNPQDISLRFMVILFSGIGCSLLLMLALAYVIFPAEIKDRRFALPFPSYPGPRLQTDPPADWQHFHAAELATLNGVGWTDRAHGRVHIPIDQAMRLIARDGAPGWPGKPSP